MFEDLLIFITIAVFVPTFVYIAKRDDLSSLSYLVLFVYTIFTQIGYVHYPQISAAAGVYFGQSSFYSYWLFILLSLIACFAGFWLSQKRAYLGSITLTGAGKIPGEFIFLGVILALCTYIGMNFARFVLDVHYGLDSSEVSPEYALFLSITRVLSLLAIVLYANCCMGRRRILSLLLLIPCLLIYVAESVAAGSRSQLLYFGIAIAVFHMHPFRVTVKKRIKAVVVCISLAGVLVYSLTVLEYIRTRFNPITMEAFATYFVQPQDVFTSNGDLGESLIAKDYYWPTHLLFVALDHDVIDPLTVASSNIANSLAGLHVEYLTEVLSREGTGHSDRITGFAFDLFIEGFVAAGWLGWLYNGMVWNLGLYLWKSATRTNNADINRTLVAMAAFILPGIMRAQSCSFVKMLWSTYLPVAFLALLSHNLIPALGKRGGESQAESGSTE